MPEKFEGREQQKSKEGDINHPQNPEKKRDTESEREPMEYASERERRLEQAREQLRPDERPEGQESEEDSQVFPTEFFGAFQQEEFHDGRIHLDEETMTEVSEKMAEFKSEAKLMTNTISGEPIATEYDSRVNNFSTQTRIMELDDGRKVFAVYAHRGSSIHRWLDNTMKWAAGLKMSKASRAQWKEQFEEKSNIPTIACEDPNMVLLPFLSNLNALDVFEYNHEIQDFGENDWAQDMGYEEKMELAKSIIEELKRVHGQDKAWGEAILPNVIFTKEQHPVICDPEVQYDDEVSFTEARARDMKDMIISVCGTLSRAEDVQELKPIVKELIDTYGDDEVLPELNKLASQKRSLLQALTFGYEQVRSTTTSKQEYDEVLKLIREVTKEV